VTGYRVAGRARVGERPDRPGFALVFGSVVIVISPRLDALLDGERGDGECGDRVGL